MTIVLSGVWEVKEGGQIITFIAKNVAFLYCLFVCWFVWIVQNLLAKFYDIWWQALAWAKEGPVKSLKPI